MKRLFIASDGHELCLWEGELDDPTPRCVERESDVDPVVWSLIVSTVGLAEGLDKLRVAVAAQMGATA